MSPNPPTSHPLMKMGFRQRWQAKFILSPYPIQAAGFTLIELSIVLVVIGLLVGGVLVGQDLIRAAAFRSQISTWEKINTATNTFKLKYGELPGDISNADNFFAGSSNGNGDGRVATGGSTTLVFSIYSGTERERCSFWYHLSQAGLIEREHSVCAHGSPVATFAPWFESTLANNDFNYIVTAACSANNCPSASFTDQHYFLSLNKYNGGSSHILNNLMGNNHWQRPAPFTVEDMRMFDNKLDDGNALTGRFGVILSTTNLHTAGQITDLCTDGATSDGYKANYTSRQCHMWLKTDF